MKMIWNRRRSNPNTILYAILAGAGAGLVVGMIMAPKSGEDMRNDIGAAVDDYLDSARERAESLRSSAANLAGRGLKEVQRTKDMIADKVRDAVSKGEDQAHAAIERTADAVNSGARKGHKAASEAASEARSAANA
jgi:gas vesicle protein